MAIYIENPNVSTDKFSKYRKHDAYKITLWKNQLLFQLPQ